MRRSMRAGLLAAVLGLAGSEAKAANLLKDGSFEKPTVPVGGYTLFATGQKIGPWTVVGATGNVAPVSGTFTQNGFTFPARSGKQWLDLTGNSNTATGVSQTVATISGGLYDLTFYVGNVVNPGGIFGTTSTVKVFVDGVLLMTAVNTSGAHTTKQVWKKFSATVTANGATTTIAFLNGDPPNDTECGLDAVSMVPQVAAADESLEPALFEDLAK